MEEGNGETLVEEAGKFLALSRLGSFFLAWQDSLNGTWDIL